MSDELDRMLVGRSVDCATCGLAKKPAGRSAPMDTVGSMCSHECDGYMDKPHPGDLWPGEKREDFGYPEWLVEVANMRNENERLTCRLPGECPAHPDRPGRGVFTNLRNEIARLKALATQAINIVFDGPPGPEGPRFVEVETDDGKGISAGDWHERDDGCWVLRITELPKKKPSHP